MKNLRAVVAYVLLGLLLYTVLKILPYLSSSNAWGAVGSYFSVVGIALFVWMGLGMFLSSAVFPKRWAHYEADESRLKVSNRAIGIFCVAMFCLGVYALSIAFDSSIGLVRHRDAPIVPILYSIGCFFYALWFPLAYRTDECKMEIDSERIWTGYNKNNARTMNIEDIESMDIYRHKLIRYLIVRGHGTSTRSRIFRPSKCLRRDIEMLKISAGVLGDLRVEDVRDFILQKQQEAAANRAKSTDVREANS